MCCYSRGIVSNSNNSKEKERKTTPFVFECLSEIPKRRKKAQIKFTFSKFMFMYYYKLKMRIFTLGENGLNKV